MPDYDRDFDFPRYQVYLGKAIRAAREDAKLTQQYVADVVGLGLRTVGEIEKGEGNPEFATLIRLVRLLNVSGNDVFYPEMIRPPFESDYRGRVALNQLKARIATRNEDELVLLNAISESALRVLRKGDTEATFPIPITT